MPLIGPYQVPFPFPPYKLQEHAVTELRKFLDAKGEPAANDDASEPTACGRLNSQLHLEESETTTSPRVVVLESPTGTGKSHILLSSALSHLFSPVYPSEAAVGEAATYPVQDHLDSSHEAAPAREIACDDEASTGEAPKESRITSLQEVLRQRELEELIAQLKRERRERVRMKRRQLRAAKKELAVQACIPTPGDGTTGEDGVEDFLIPQQRLEVSTAGVNGIGSNAFSQGATASVIAPLYSFSSSSSSRSSSASSSRSEEGTSYRSMEDLAGVIPLRRPKAYFASRTHTQLQQLFDDLRQTDFVRYPIITRNTQLQQQQQQGQLQQQQQQGQLQQQQQQGQLQQQQQQGQLQQQQQQGRGQGGKRPSCGTAARSPSPPRRLRAVHVAGRQQLCLNADLRRKAAGLSAPGAAPAEALNELCLEAMRFEHSPAGRVFRRRADAQAAAAGTFTSQAQLPLGDIEDVGGSTAAAHEAKEKGCAYCATQRLHTLIRYVQTSMESKAATSNSHSSPPSDFPSGPLSMQELKHWGEELKACPYLATRLLVRGADVVMIPYGYLVEEGQREALLGGAATNPLTEEEHFETFERQAAALLQQRQTNKIVANTVGSNIDFARSGLPREGNRIEQNSHVFQPHTPICNLISTSPQFNRHSGGVSSSEPGACFTGDVVVIDEAHNIADYCRSVSTAAIRDIELRIVSSTVDEYLKRYENRLLTKNKQRLREILLFIRKLILYASAFVKKQAQAVGGGAEGGSSSVGRFGRAGGDVHEAVLIFSTFLFETDLAHIDVFEFLEFLQETRLFSRLQGFAAAALTHEAASRADVNKKVRVDRCQGGKAGELSPPASACKAPTFLNSMEELLPTTQGGTPAAVELFRTEITRALRRFEHLLRIIYTADDATRVLLMPTLSSSFKGEVGFLLKLLPLDPGRRTLYPVFSAAHAVVLAGGTMQPLSLVCAPLLPSSRGKSFRQLALISEPHVVPSSSIAVWALARGPSGLRLEFSQKTLSAATSEEVQTTSREGCARAPALFTELAMTLLNLCRVLPPAGVICFFTSHEIARTFTAFLRSSGYYEQINAVKRIFVEGELQYPQTTMTATTYTGGKREREHVVLRERLEVDNNEDLAQSSPMAAMSLGGMEEAKTAGGNNRGTEALLAEYRSYVLGGERGGGGGAQDSTSRPSTERNTLGALLFAVMGGRLSEGINFSDDLGRAVLVVGVPYANPTDLELQLNLRHIAAMNVTSGGEIEAFGSISDPQNHERHLSRICTASIGDDGGGSDQPTERRLSQAQWELYTDLCMRTVNQCIGRCIRHSRDYAAVVLLDARYAERTEIRRRIPSWIQPSFKSALNFGECFRGVRNFFAQQ